MSAGNIAQQNFAIYNRDAEKLAIAYGALETPDVIPAFAQTLLSLPDKEKCRILDLGCGTGRHSAWIAAQGFDVVAVDGSEGMLAQAAHLNPSPRIRYIRDEAPALPNTKSLKMQFDVILMAAFLFHMDETGRQELYKNLLPLTKEGSYLYATLRHGPVPEGRRMFEVPVTELETFARDNGARFNNLGHRPDAGGRPEISWDHAELRFSDQTAS